MNRALAIFLLMSLLAGSVVAQPAKSATDPKIVQKQRAELDTAKAKYAKTKAAFVKKPKDAALKKQYVDATVIYGTVTMNSPLLSPKNKYPVALNLYREALRHDPSNKEALNNKQLIEGIYRQMGRPIPQ